MQNPVFAHLALSLLRLDRTSQETQRISMWIPEGAAVVQLSVDWASPNNGIADFAGIAMQFETDEVGWLRSVRIPVQGVSVKWQPTLEAEVEVRSGGVDTIPPEGILESPYSFSE